MVHITDPDILSKIREIEGQQWDNLTDVNTRMPALKAYDDWKNTNDDPEQMNTGIVIYGDGGYNRYYVRGNGEVVLSYKHASSRSLDDAARAGFAIFR